MPDPQAPPAPRAVVLLSGGADSAVCLAMAQAAGYECHCITFFYGQRHHIEIEAAKRIALGMRVASHRLVPIDLAAPGGSALTDRSLDVPKAGDAPTRGSRSEIPLTYVPARNTVFLAFALAYAEVLDARAIYIGVNAIDYSGYPDCRPEFIEAFQRVASLATRAGVEGRGPTIVTPLIGLTKAQIFRAGIDLQALLALTTSCYDPVMLTDAVPKICGSCEACRIRAAGFAELGVPDPALS
ncbi:MAG: 7-cyano-7-deazaguanine synthase QueC [Planctomycetota bacterium]|nr:7-cyano-7-deazaguanine synthase QueC [Planctomycetota bacterium]